MSFECHQRVIAGHAFAVIDDSNQPFAACFECRYSLFAPASSAFSSNSLTTDAGRSTTSPAGNLVGEQVRQHSDLRH